MSGSGTLDPRLNPVRPDLAAAHLRGIVQAERFADGARRLVAAGLADIRRRPSSDAPLDTQALHGESVTLYDEEEGWGWVQLGRDGYVGYVEMRALSASAPAASHCVTVNRTFVYPAPDMKRPPLAALTLGAEVAVDGQSGAFASLGAGFVFSGHLAPVDQRVADFVATAERLLHTPYLWGGKSALGIDCSGLVQIALASAGTSVPRDTDLQQERIGAPVPFDATLRGVRRGDLVFWPGHVGIMRDSEILIHANAHHMSVAEEPLRRATDRILRDSQAYVSAIRRIAI